ncbi:MAG: helix-turn-helix domain-containing protein [Anaerolineales bacterium]|nr:helix-turn-helix domain-containing protein [Anaerolineales bacterium]
MEDPVMTIPEVARYLKLSKSKVYYLVQQRQIPPIHIGRNVRVREKDIQRWLKAHSVDAPKH